MAGALRRLVALASVAALLSVSFVGLSAQGGAHAWTQADKIWNPSEGSGFGANVATDEDLLVVSGGGGVHVYEQSPEGTWKLAQVLHAEPNPFTDDGPWGHVNGQRYGRALAVDASAGVLAVGAAGFDVTGDVQNHETDAGAVYVYEQAPNGTWEFAKRFVGPVNGDWNDLEDDEDSNAGPHLGASVAADADTIVAGVPRGVVNDTPLRGKAEVYQRQPNGSWERTEKLASPSDWAVKWDEFGKAVAVKDELVAIGTPGEATGATQEAGAVHLYEQTEVGVVHADRLAPAVARSGDHEARVPMEAPNTVKTRMEDFGFAIAFDEDASTLVVGAPYSNRLADVSPPTSTDLDMLGADTALTHPWGAVYVFSVDDAADGHYDHVATLENPDRERFSRFGENLALADDGSTVVVGVRYGNHSRAFPTPSTGTAYVFETTTEGWSCGWRLSGDDTDLEGQRRGDLFGASVALSGGDRALVGAPLNGPDDPGSLYAFEPTTARDPGVLHGPTLPASPCRPDVQR